METVKVSGSIDGDDDLPLLGVQKEEYGENLRHIKRMNLSFAVLLQIKPNILFRN